MMTMIIMVMMTTGVVSISNSVIILIATLPSCRQHLSNDGGPEDEGRLLELFCAVLRRRRPIYNIVGGSAEMATPQGPNLEA